MSALVRGQYFAKLERDDVREIPGIAPLTLDGLPMPERSNFAGNPMSRHAGKNASVALQNGTPLQV